MAGWTTQRDYTMLRALVMDFPEDRAARELNDEYMFGPALLVAPITQYQQRSRSVYLPSGAQWYEYWSGRPASSGSIVAAAPYDEIPVFVRAGSIIPYQPDMQYIGEKAADLITLCVYAGANGRFTLYEDQGTTFDYEKGAFSEIPMQWDDRTHTLTIGERTGAFTGMLPQRTFRVVLVSKTHPAGFPFTANEARNVEYKGAATRIQLH
jgi:alpha-D-xyloside xylohydrolase